METGANFQIINKGFVKAPIGIFFGMMTVTSTIVLVCVGFEYFQVGIGIILRDLPDYRDYPCLDLFQDS